MPRIFQEQGFPRQALADNWAPLSCREFLRLMGAALALAGVGGCASQPPHHTRELAARTHARGSLGGLY
jgi:hypothetical protein